MLLLQDTGMEVYKQVAFRRSFSLLHWFHHLVILFGLPWYYRRMKVGSPSACPWSPPARPAMKEKKPVFKP